MSTAPHDLEPPKFPETPLHHRMAIALEVSGVKPAEMTKLCDAHPNSVHAWLRGARKPKMNALRIWAARTGVALSYLTGNPEDDDDGGIVISFRPRNPQGDADHGPLTGQYVTAIAA